MKSSPIPWMLRQGHSVAVGQHFAVMPVLAEVLGLRFVPCVYYIMRNAWHARPLSTLLLHCMIHGEVAELVEGARLEIV